MKAAADFLRDPPAPESVPCAVAAGAEELLRTRVADALTPAGEETEVFDAAATGESGFDAAAFFDALRTPSLFGDRRTFRVRRADRLLADAADATARVLASGEAAHRVIFECESAPPKTKAAEGKARGKSKAAGLAATIAAVEAAGGVAVRCDPLYDAPYQGRGPAWQSELTRWVQDEARSRGKEMSAQVAFRLHQLVGNRLRDLAAEVEKLATYAGARPALEAEDVERLVGASRASPAFDFGEALAACDLKAALKLSAELFERGVADAGGRRLTDETTTAMMLLAAATSRLRRVGAAWALLRRGASFEEAAGAVGVPPFLRDRFRAQCEAWRRRDPAKALEALVELERGLKGGGGPARTLIDRCATALLARGRAV